jgi:hypothetical protein
MSNADAKADSLAEQGVLNKIVNTPLQSLGIYYASGRRNATNA